MDEVASRNRKREREEEAEAKELGVSSAEILDQKLQEELAEKYRLEAIAYLEAAYLSLWKQGQKVLEAAKRIKHDDDVENSPPPPSPPH